MRVLVTFGGQQNSKMWLIHISKISITWKTMDIYCWLQIVFHLIAWVYKIDNQYRHNSWWWYKWRKLNLWKILLNFYVSYHKKLLTLEHRYYSFRGISNNMLCIFIKHIIHVFFHFFFERFIYMQYWINHICNLKLDNEFLCFMKINKALRYMQ